MIEVILPVVNYGMAKSLLEGMDNNTLRPDRILLVDNTGRKNTVWPKAKFEIKVCHSLTRGLNESWELARALLNKETEYVSYLNDDIVIGPWFFQRTIETFHKTNCAISCPNTVNNIGEVKKGRISYRISGGMIPGWAFTIKKEFLNNVPPIPYKRITLFYGDNWVWKHVKDKGGYWAKDLGNNIFHYVGTSIRKLDLRHLKKKEAREWLKIKNELWGQWR